MKQIPILSLRFPEIKASANPAVTTKLLGNAKALASDNRALFAKNGIDPDIFHNDNIEYSGIQLGNYQGMQEWTAIGKKHTKALKLWYRIFKKQNANILQNTVIITETYKPGFLDFSERYKIPVILINDDLAKELNHISDKFARYDRLEKYLFGNIQRFFNHIGFVHDKSQNFLKINITRANLHSKSKQVYHQHKKTAFEIIFDCNFYLPQTLRLGQSTALGYGRTYHLTN
jgi:hypothetical protein